MSAWQPIETAPKDGTSILLWFAWEMKRPTTPLGMHFVARWSEHDAFPTGAWVDPADCDLVGAGPTHWMPLPSPPEAA